jgi:hypothetical protein
MMGEADIVWAADAAYITLNRLTTDPHLSGQQHKGADSQNLSSAGPGPFAVSGARTNGPCHTGADACARAAGRRPRPRHRPHRQTQTASQAAIASGSTGDYRAARRAERMPASHWRPCRWLRSTPVDARNIGDAGSTPAVAPAQPETERQLSRRQQQINDYERRIAEQDQRIRALESRPATPAAQEPAPAPAAPEWKKYRDMADAPKMADFDSVEDHAAAMALFIADKRADDRARVDQERSTAEQLTAAQQQRVETFVTQLHDARAADPEFVNKLSPVVRDHVKPFAALRPGENSGPVNVIGELVYDSPIAPKVLLHLSTNPDALKRLLTPPPHVLALPRAAQANAHTQWMVREFGKLEGSLETPSAPATPVAPAPVPKLVTDAPAPPHTLGARPAPAADTRSAVIKSGNTRAYREMRRKERALERAR